MTQEILRSKQRRSLRLKGYDYRQPGAYFVTICTVGRECLLGEIQGEEVIPTSAGQLVRGAWDDIAARFPSVATDAFIVMPNHVHGIIIIGTLEHVPALPKGRVNSAPTLSAVIQAFKSLSTLHVNRLLKRSGALWQRNYYERVIRTEDELDRVRHYIVENAKKWPEDEENPERHKELLKA